MKAFDKWPDGDVFYLKKGLDLHSFMVSCANADSDADINTDGMVDSQDVAGFARDLARLFHELRRPASQGDL